MPCFTRRLLVSGFDCGSRSSGIGFSSVFGELANHASMETEQRRGSGRAKTASMSRSVDLEGALYGVILSPMASLFDAELAKVADWDLRTAFLSCP